MSLETSLAIASFAIGIGGLFPVFRLPKNGKVVALGFVISALILLSSVGLYQVFQHKSEIRYVSSEVLKSLDKRPSTIDSLERNIHHVNFSHLLEALDFLVRSGKIHYEIVKLHDPQQNPYTIGVYSNTL